MSALSTSPTNWLSNNQRFNARSLDQFCLYLVDLGIACVIFLAPLFMAGRHPVGQLAFVGIVAATTIAWAVRQCVLAKPSWTRTGTQWILLAGLVVLLLQLLPLSAATLSRISPSVAETLPLWSESTSLARQGSWSQISLMPDATRRGVTMFLSFAMLFVVVVQRIESRDDIERLLRWLALAALLMAGVGLAQFLFGNGKFLWFYEHPTRHTHRVVKGTFSNENHFAHFLTLGLAPLMWWVWRSMGDSNSSARDARRSAAGTVRRSAAGTVRRSARRTSSFATSARGESREAARIGLAVALGVVALACLLTFSRGGVLVMFLTFAVVVGLFAKKSLLGKRSLVALGAVGLVVCSALFLYGSEQLMQQLGTLGVGDIDELDQRGARRKLWRADLLAFSDFPIFGTGSGSHAEVYPTYYPEYSHAEYTMAESGYIQVLMETGVVGLTLLVIAIATLGYWCLRTLRQSTSRRDAACGGAICAALAASAVHSIWDFVWYIPACLSLTIILAACACRLCQLTREGHPTPAAHGDSRRHRVHPPRVVWISAALVVVGLSTFMIRNRVGPAFASPHWEMYYSVALVAERDASQPTDSSIESQMAMVERALERNPNDARAHLALASQCLQRFDLAQQQSPNPMPLAQIRDAVNASGFSSFQDRRKWLDLVLGENKQFLDKAERHARRAAELCPFQGEAYIYLADLAFLSHENHQAVATAHIDQALRVRPYRGAVLLAAGQHAAWSGDTEAALSFWKKAFQQDPQSQRQIVALLAPKMPAEFFLSEFDPDVDGLAALFVHYKKNNDIAQAGTIGRRYAPLLESKAATEQSSTSARLWWRALSVYQLLEDRASALRCASRAVETDPANYGYHRALGIELIAHQRFDEAIEQLTWCQRRKPNDAAIKQQLSVATRGRLTGAAAATIAKERTSQQQQR